MFGLCVSLAELDISPRPHIDVICIFGHRLLIMRQCMPETPFVDMRLPLVSSPCNASAFCSANFYVTWQDFLSQCNGRIFRRFNRRSNDSCLNISSSSGLYRVAALSGLQLETRFSEKEGQEGQISLTETCLKSATFLASLYLSFQLRTR